MPFSFDRPTSGPTPSLLFLLGLSSYFLPSYAVVPSSSLTISSPSVGSEVLYVSESFGFGSPLPKYGGDVRGPLTLVKSSDLLSAAGYEDGDDPYKASLLCDDLSLYPASTDGTGAVALVPRGNCTYAQKAQAAYQLGASGVVVYETTASKYKYDQDKAEAGGGVVAKGVVWPSDKRDYDCDRGSGRVSPDAVELPYAVDVEENDSATAASCSCTGCLLTGRSYDGSELLDDLSGSSYQTCCAWDLHVILYGDNKYDPPIPAVFATMKQAKTLAAAAETADVTIYLEKRWEPPFNLGGLAIWALGVAVAVWASYGAADDLREGTKKIMQAETNGDAGASAGREANRGEQDWKEEEIQVLTMRHAFGFLLVSSCTLLLLYYTEAYNFVKIMYALACSGMVAQLILYPLARNALARYSLDSVAFVNRCLGEVSRSDVVATVLGHVWGGIWLYIALAVPHPQMPFFWITQNIFGACLCSAFLKTARLPNLKIASALLGAAFVYDIFFVFITPYIFSSSVMLTVATSGGPPSDPDFCEKYPTESDCLRGDPLPMLFSLPNPLDYSKSSSLLGIGDVVLPGLILALCARMDEARALLGAASDGRRNGRGACPASDRRAWLTLAPGGYFIPVCAAYAVGLAMAFAAVVLMQMGQPALLYLVPMTVGTVAFLGWRRGEINDLWNGPRFLESAQTLLDGGNRSEEDRSDITQYASDDNSASSIDPIIDSDPPINPII